MAVRRTLKKVLQRAGHHIQKTVRGKTPQPSQHAPTAAPEALAEHLSQLRKEVIEVVPGVHVAIGYGLANSILLEGDQGVVIVDTLESNEAATAVKEHFARINPAPVRAIIYTHNHADHIYGSTVMAGKDNPEVYAHETTRACILRIANILRPAIFTRSMRQFGSLLDKNDFLHAGIGPELRYDTQTSPQLLWPTKTFADELHTTIAGIELEMYHTPGETPDHICVWMPEKKVLIPGDNFYCAFPNLYAIRGTSYRDVMAWAHSIDKLRSLGAEYLIPCHTRPIYGRALIETTLRNYRDAIQYVHDQTIRGLNRGYTPDELVARIALPPHLASQPYLQEFYGRVDWSVRSICSGYLGWFDGDSANLDALTAKERAKRMCDLVGSVEALLAKAKHAQQQGDELWALELTNHVLALDRDHTQARTFKALLLRKRAAQETSANGRNYRLTQARELDGSLQTPRASLVRSSQNLLPSLPLSQIFQSMCVNLNGPACWDEDVVLGFTFTDTREEWTLHIRHGVADVQPKRPEQAELRITTTAQLWKEFLTGTRNQAKVLASGALHIEGSTPRFVRILLWFRA